MSTVTEVVSPVTGTVWKIEAGIGQQIAEGGIIALIESMKMEIPVQAECAGVLRELRYKEGEAVEEGGVFATLDTGAA